MDQLRLSEARPGPTPLPVSTWLRRVSAVEQEAAPRAVLVLLPHAGGAAYTYLSWAPVLPASVAVYAVEYPGHGARIGEPLVDDLRTVVSDLADQLAELPDVAAGCPLILGGHSLGALLAYELAAEAQKRGRAVAGLFLSGAVPAERRSPERDSTLLDDDALVAVLGAAGDIPVEILQDAEARELYLPVVRHDLELASRHCGDLTAGTGGPLVRTRAVVVGGAEDGRCPAADLAAWAELVDGPAEVIVLPGGHFYYRDQLAVVGRLVEGLVPAP